MSIHLINYDDLIFKNFTFFKVMFYPETEMYNELYVEIHRLLT